MLAVFLAGLDEATNQLRAASWKERHTWQGLRASLPYGQQGSEAFSSTSCKELSPAKTMGA